MLDILSILVATSLGMSIAFLALTALTPVLSRQFSPQMWRWVWRLMSLSTVIMLQYALFQQPLPYYTIQLTPPKVLVETDYGGTDGYRADLDYLRAEIERSEAAGDSYQRQAVGDSFGYSFQYSDDTGRDWSIQDNWYQRTVTENGVTTRTVHWSTLLFWLWLAVAVLYFVGVHIRYFRFRRKALRWATPAGESDLAALAEQRKRTGCKDKVALYRCPLVRSPLLMGWITPVILLPEDMPQDALGPALAHELTHLEENHLEDKWMYLLPRSIYWFNPLIWRMTRRAEQDLELCCDYLLLRGQDEQERRAYGQAILSQMTAGKRDGAPLTTGFSGSKQEVFRRFRAIMDLSPKRRGILVGALLTGFIFFAQTLVSCQSVQAVKTPDPEQTAPDISGSAVREPFNGQTGPDGTLLVFGTISDDQTAEYERINWFSRYDTDAEETWMWMHREGGSRETLNTPFAQDAELLYWYGEDTYPLNPATIESSIRQSQYGRLMELTFNEAGEIARLVLRGGVSLDMAGANLDFTGFSGTIYARGESIILQDDSKSAIASITVNPCTAGGYDEDDSYYFLNATDAFISLALRNAFSPFYDGKKPYICQLEMVNGSVTAVRTYLEFAEYFDRFNNNNAARTGLTASIGHENGLWCYMFSNQEYGIYLLIDDAPIGDGSGYYATLQYGVRSMDFVLPIHPLAPFLGHVAGEADLFLTDLTGDGVPELVFVHGYHSSGLGSDACMVFDPEAMEQIPVSLDFSDMEENIHAELVEQWTKDDYQFARYRITGPITSAMDPDNQDIQGTLQFPAEWEWEIDWTLHFDEYYKIRLNHARDGLELNCSLSLAESPMMWLGQVSVPLVYSPSAKLISPRPSYTVDLNIG